MPHVKAHEVAALLQWHIRNDFISHSALTVLCVLAALALIIRNATGEAAAEPLWVSMGAVVLCGAGYRIARLPLRSLDELNKNNTH